MGLIFNDIFLTWMLNLDAEPQSLGIVERSFKGVIYPGMEVGKLTKGVPGLYGSTAIAVFVISNPVLPLTQ